MLAKLFVEDHRGPRDDIDHLKDKIIALQEDKIRDLERNNAKLDLILVQMQKIIDGLELGVAR